MRWASDKFRWSKLPIFLRAECSESVVLADELFFGPRTKCDHRALDVLSDLALGEFAGVTKAKY